MFSKRKDKSFNKIFCYINEICKLNIKRIYLSKALTCVKVFLFKQKMYFYKGDGYLWPYCCMNNLYISHRSLYAPTYSFLAIRSMFFQSF